MEENKLFYAGKKFSNWNLEIDDEFEKCITFKEPNLGLYFGKFCNPNDKAAFSEKYKNYRKGTRFTIKSGTIDKWFAGIILKDLTF